MCENLTLPVIHEHSALASEQPGTFLSNLRTMMLLKEFAHSFFLLHPPSSVKSYRTSHREPLLS